MSQDTTSNLPKGRGLTLETLKALNDTIYAQPAYPTDISVGDMDSFLHACGVVDYNREDMVHTYSGVPIKESPHIPKNKAVIMCSDGSCIVVELKQGDS